MPIPALAPVDKPELCEEELLPDGLEAVPIVELDGVPLVSLAETVALPAVVPLVPLAEAVVVAVVLPVAVAPPVAASEVVVVVDVDVDVVLV